MDRDLNHTAPQGVSAGHHALSMRDGARPLPIAPVAMMLPTFLGPLMMVIGEPNRHQPRAG